MGPRDCFIGDVLFEKKICWVLCMSYHQDTKWQQVQGSHGYSALGLWLCIEFFFSFNKHHWIVEGTWSWESQCLNPHITDWKTQWLDESPVLWLLNESREWFSHALSKDSCHKKSHVMLVIYSASHLFLNHTSLTSALFGSITNMKPRKDETS